MMDSSVSSFNSLPRNEGYAKFPNNSKYSTPSKLKNYTDYDLKITPIKPKKAKLAQFCPYSVRTNKSHDLKPPSIPHSPLLYKFTSKPFPPISPRK